MRSALAPAAIGALASLSLMEEPRIWPRFGLVGPADSGAHRDMSYVDLVCSARALEPFFAQSAQMGSRLSAVDPSAALEWRHSGLAAEQTMYAATGGVNTHKGAIFLLGLLAFSYGRLSATPTPAVRGAALSERVLDVAHRALAWRMREELWEARCRRPGSSETYGHWAYRRFRWGGMRHTVTTDFQGLRQALRSRAHRRGVPDAVALGLVRHQLFVASQDSNLVKRAGWRTAQRVQMEARASLRLGSMRTPAGFTLLQSVDREMAARGWSASGTGDLLAAYVFLDRLDGLDRGWPQRDTPLGASVEAR